jgi:hypothetical protein
MTILIPTKLLEEISDREFDIGQRVRGTTLGKFADHANQQCFRESLWSFNVSFINAYDTTQSVTGAGNPSLNHITSSSALVLPPGGSFAQNQTTTYAGGIPKTAQTFKIDLPSKSEAAESVGFILTYVAAGTAYDADANSTPHIYTAHSQPSVINLRLEKKANANSFTVVDPPSSSSESWAVTLSEADATLPENRIISEADVTSNVFNSNGTVTRAIIPHFRGKAFRVLRTIGTVDLGDSDATIPRRMHYNQTAGASGEFAITIEYVAAIPIELFVFEIPKIAL